MARHPPTRVYPDPELEAQEQTYRYLLGDVMVMREQDITVAGARNMPGHITFEELMIVIE